MNKSKQKDSLIFTDKRLEFLFVYFGSSSLLVSKVANVQPRSLSSSAILDVSVTCQGCRENSPRKIRAQFQASSGYSDSANWPEYEAGE